jgi:hypothetical protein
MDTELGKGLGPRVKKCPQGLVVVIVELRNLSVSMWRLHRTNNSLNKSFFRHFSAASCIISSASAVVLSRIGTGFHLVQSASFPSSDNVPYHASKGGFHHQQGARFRCHSAAIHLPLASRLSRSLFQHSFHICYSNMLFTYVN